MKTSDFLPTPKEKPRYKLFLPKKILNGFFKKDFSNAFWFSMVELLEFLLQKGRDCGLLFLYPQWLTLSTDLFPDLLLLLIYSYDTQISLLVKPRPMYSLAHRSFFFF